ncbi:hypothetical protein [Caulobacter sp. 17J80-11]|uniref:hypothetical protein n=1 Tax=Caulobacter sp. 17J80-11 TaxID=2763502 RepID=UPI001653E001|nr:hypothetical protein [Caulobacter sp. 17J80-11]MBC6981338.1 hypothetical protein [Caulobacter sp. 17J80-11]
MRAMVAAGVLAAAVLGGCVKKEEAAPAAEGRYQGVGAYEPGEVWPQIARAEAPTDPAAAVTEDDERVIVVVDSTTGEIRQCGSYSGFCISMNPWTKPGAEGQPPVRLDAPTAPVTMTKHAEDLRKEREAEAAKAG